MLMTLPLTKMKTKEREKREQERKYQIQKTFWRIMDDNDPLEDDGDIGAEFFN